MPFFVSAIQNAIVRDKHNRRVGRLKDLLIPRAINIPDVIGIVIKQGKQQKYLPWKTIALVAQSEIRLNISEDAIPQAPPPDALFLVRDLLDAQVVDISGAKVVRVNDIILSLIENHLFISGLDIGTWGLMRRLGWASVFAWLVKRLHLKVAEGIIPWDNIGPIEKEASKVRLAVAQDRLIRMHPADLADIVEEMGYHQRSQLLGKMTDAQLADLLEESDPAIQSAILRELDPERAADVLEEMEPDEAVDLLADLPEEEAQNFIRRMKPSEAAEIKQLLSYEEGTAGAIMTTSYVAIDGRITVGDTLRWYRKSFSEAEIVAYIYLTDPNGHLTGAVSIRRLLLAEPHIRMACLATQKLITVEPGLSADEVVDEMAHYNLAALPVVGPNQQLLGVISIQDALEYVRGEGEG